jgi:1-acyl-sn-glycerol-3-phosphate acyltransferase
MASVVVAAEGSARPSRAYLLLYRLCQSGLRAWYRSRLDLQVTGLEHLPLDRPCVVVANHPSAMDGALLIAVLPRVFGLWARGDRFRNPLVAWFLRIVGIVPTESGAGALAVNLDARERARDYLAQGRAFLSLPESDVSHGPLPGPFRPGFVYLAADVGCPIVPVAIAGADRAFADPRAPGRLRQLVPRRARVHVDVLPPVAVESAAHDRQSARALADLVRGLIEAQVAGRLATLDARPGW